MKPLDQPDDFNDDLGIPLTNYGNDDNDNENGGQRPSHAEHDVKNSMYPSMVDPILRHIQIFGC